MTARDERPAPGQAPARELLRGPENSLLDAASVLVVGTGLIGTSIGLALRGSARVLLDDANHGHVQLAAERGAGVPWDHREQVDIAVVATPPSAIAPLVAALLENKVALTVTHVASVQSRVAVEVEAGCGPLSESFCGGHPLAGREVRGPQAASARLFVDRPWAVCAGMSSSQTAVVAVRALARACGAVPVDISPADHDAAVALLSHLPQVTASALAARLVSVDAAETPTSLAGPGLQDTTRVAASDPMLWTEILAGNAVHLAPLVRALAEDLAAAADALDALASGDQAGEAVLSDLLERGKLGRDRVPLKPAGDLVPVVVEVEDRPAQIAGVLGTTAGAGVNVEDVRVEHLRGRPRGLVELMVTTAEADRARAALLSDGWQVVGE